MRPLTPGSPAGASSHRDPHRAGGDKALRLGPAAGPAAGFDGDRSPPAAPGHPAPSPAAPRPPGGDEEWPG